MGKDQLRSAASLELLQIRVGDTFMTDALIARRKFLVAGGAVAATGASGLLRPASAAGLAPSKTMRGGSNNCLLYTSPSPRDRQKSRMPSSA